MQLANANNPTNTEDMRYLIIAGCDKTNGTFKVYDMEIGDYEWVSRDKLMNGGYVTGNANIKFSGSIIESVS